MTKLIAISYSDNERAKQALQTVDWLNFEHLLEVKRHAGLNGKAMKSSFIREVLIPWPRREHLVAPWAYCR